MRRCWKNKILAFFENVRNFQSVTEESRGTNNLDYARTIEKDDFLCSYRREDYKDVKMVFESMKDGGLETIIDNKHQMNVKMYGMNVNEMCCGKIVIFIDVNMNIWIN